MSRLRTHALPIVILVFAAAAAALIWRDEPRSDWLTVSGSAKAVMGEAIDLAVVLREPLSAGFLHVDLHGYDARDVALRCVAAGAPLAVTAAQVPYSFRLHIPEREDLVRARLVIYLSRSGKWKDHTRVSVSESFEIGRGTQRGTGGPDQSAIVVRDQFSEPVVETRVPSGIRAGVATIWLIAAALAFQVWRRGSRANRSAPLLAILLLAIALWEFGTWGTGMTDTFRHAAQAEGLYSQRRGFQQAATAVVTLLVGSLAAVFIRRTREQVPGATVFGVSVFIVVAVAELLSLHEVDRFLAGHLQGDVSIAAAVHGAAALSAAAGLLIRFCDRHSDPGGAPSR